MSEHSTISWLAELPQISLRQVRGITDAQCVLVSQIGRPVDDPQVADVRVEYKDGITSDTANRHVAKIVDAAFARIDELRQDVIAQRLSLY